MIKIAILTVCLLLPLFSFSKESNPEVAIVVDKKDNEVHLVQMNAGAMNIVKSYHATLGKVTGDKMVEGDLKTPNGIYDLTAKLGAPTLKPIFGPLAMYVGYPNAFDKKQKKTGFDIMIHGTDDPSRLAKNFDTKGCVALDNGIVKEISDQVTLRKTKVIITNDFHSLQASNRYAKEIAFLNSWVTAWETKNITEYGNSYTSDFNNSGMNLQAYINYKDTLNKKYPKIQVKAENPQVYLHEKYDIIEFYQSYNATTSNGKPLYSKRAKKRLWVSHENDSFKIALEESIH